MNFRAGLGAADEVAFLLVGVAPLACGIPVPGLDHQLSILTIGHGLPSRAENFVQQRIFQQVVGSAGAQAVDGRAQRADGAEGVGDVGGVGIDNNLLRRCQAYR